MKPITAVEARKRIRRYQRGDLSAFEAFCTDCIRITGGDDDSGDTSAVQFKWWPAQRELAKTLCNPESGEVIVLKARQLGITWVVLAWQLYRIMFWYGIEERITSVGQEESSKALRRVKFMIDNLPDWCRPTLEISNTTTIKIEETESWLTALPATINAGRGDTLNDILVDECAFQVYAKQIIVSARPALEKRHGKLIVVSTANGVGNYFQEQFMLAERGENGFKPFFFGWSADPHRNKAWYDRMLKQHGREFMSESYPSTAAEAFLATGRPYYEQTRVVADLSSDLPMFHDGFVDAKDFYPSAQGALRVWKKPDKEKAYIMWADTAEGLEHGDYNNCYVIEVGSLDTAARVRGKMDSTEYADALMAAGYWYNTAIICVERNCGMATLKRVLESGYPNVWMDRNLVTGEIKADTYGWHTNVSTRQAMLGKSQGLYRQGRVKVVDRDLLEEMALFAHRGARGKAQAPPGKTDDCVVSWAGAIYLATYEIPEEKEEDEFAGLTGARLAAAESIAKLKSGESDNLNAGVEELGG